MREKNPLEELLEQALKPEAPTEAPSEEPAEEQPQEEIMVEPVPQDEAPQATPEEGEPVQEISAPQAETPNPAIGEPVPYHQRYYLKYREGKRNAPMDLEGTRAFLQGLGFDGGELRKARDGKNCAEQYRNADRERTQQCCSYCGTEIAGVEFYRMRDGRMRCTTCSNTVLKTKAEVEQICRRVLDNLNNFFGASIDVPIAIEVTEERKLKKKIGVPLGTRDGQSILVLGVAVNKKGKYSIILENGAPRISVIATLAHELTHIWQYTHWDNRKNFPECPKNKRLLIYEGMAKWVEIQYLYLIGETNVAKREEFITRNRQDEYGLGFLMYEDQYPLSREAMSSDSTPFTTDSYPI
jgi:hypothetical protein